MENCKVCGSTNFIRRIEEDSFEDVTVTTPPNYKINKKELHVTIVCKNCEEERYVIETD